MPIVKRTARSVEEFIKIASGLRTGWKMNKVMPWFRGHANAEWPLVPKFYRQQSTDRVDEDNIREEFITRAPVLSDVKPNTSWDWYFLMQHYGAPTRLLDWTEGALIGLYFAVRERPGYQDAAVWVLDPWELNKRVVRKDEVVPPGEAGTSAQDRQRYVKWLPERFVPGKRWPPRPVAIYPGHIVRRIGAQRSCFTIHGVDQRGLEAISDDVECVLTKITIPSWDAREIRHTLDTCGVDDSTVFPDLAGLSKAVEFRYTKPKESPPHSGVYTRLRPSEIAKGGIGVFAIRKIKKDAHLFEGDNDEIIWLKESEVGALPKGVRQLYRDFPVIKNEEGNNERRYGCPLSFNRLTVSWYINHSQKPNVRCDESFNFYALRTIEPGEELTVDYSTYSD
jgi:FRG domain/SET domain